MSVEQNRQIILSLLWVNWNIGMTMFYLFFSCVNTVKRNQQYHFYLLLLNGYFLLSWNILFYINNDEFILLLGFCYCQVLILIPVFVVVPTWSSYIVEKQKPGTIHFIMLFLNFFKYGTLLIIKERSEKHSKNQSPRSITYNINLTAYHLRFNWRSKSTCRLPLPFLQVENCLTKKI